MRQAPDGLSFFHIGDDGVMRVVSSEDHTILDARGMTPDEFKGCIRHYLRKKSPEELQERLREVEGIDGRLVSREAQYNPAPGILPPLRTTEERAAVQ